MLTVCLVEKREPFGGFHQKLLKFLSYIFAKFFHSKATKNRFSCAFNFALRKSRFLEKATSLIEPFSLAFDF